MRIMQPWRPIMVLLLVSMMMIILPDHVVAQEGDTSVPTSAPVPIVPVPTPPPGNHSHHHDDNSTATPSPTLAPSNHNHSNVTIAPTVAPSIAPTTLPPHTAAPSKKYNPPLPPHHDNHTDHPTTEHPSPAPTTPADNNDNNTGGGISFLDMMQQMIAWCILMGLSVLLYGFCIQHQYHILYYLRHLGHCLVGINQWLLQKVRPDFQHNLQHSSNYMHVSDRNDSYLFDAPDSHSLHLHQHLQDDDGFVMGQHSNTFFRPMG